MFSASEIDREFSSSLEKYLSFNLNSNKKKKEEKKQYTLCLLLNCLSINSTKSKRTV